MENIEQTLDSIRSSFSSLPDSDAKWAFLLQIAKDHPVLPDELRDEKFLVKGCATRLFLVPKYEQGVVRIMADTDGGAASPLIVRGLAALAVRVYDQRTPQEILSVQPEFFQSIGLNVALSATRANGFASMLKQIYMYARVFAAMQK